MRRTVLLLYLPLLMSGLIGACTGSRSALKQPEPTPAVRPADPEALSHFIDAKLAQMRGDRVAAIRHLRIATKEDSLSATLQRALAENLVALKQFAQAVGPSRAAVRIAPDDLTSRWLLFHALFYGQQDTASAKSQLASIARLGGDDLETLWRIGGTYFETLQDTASAVVPMERMTQLAPHDVRAYNRLLRIYAEQGRRTDILRTLDRVASIPNLNRKGLLYVAQNYERYNAPGRAADTYRAILQDNPNEMGLWVRLSNLRQEMADTAAAVQALRTGLAHQDHSLSPSTTPAWKLTVRLYDRPGALDRLLSESPLDSTFAEHLSRIYLVEARNPRVVAGARSVRLNQSLRLVNRLIGETPTRADLLAKKGDVLLATGNTGEARAAYRLALTLDTQAHYWLMIARTHALEGAFEQAIGILETLRAQAPTGSGLFPGVVFDLGRAYASIGRNADARALYREAAEAVPDDPRYRFELGRLFAADREWDQAVAEFEALEDAATDNDAFLNRLLFELGRSYERSGRIDESVATFQRLLARKPDNHTALNYLGYTLAEKGIRLSEAKGYIERALAADPGNGAYLDSMGWVLFRQASYRESMDYIQRALAAEEAALASAQDRPSRPEIEENLAIIHDHAGDAAKALGDLGKARYHRQRAADLDPENATFSDKLRSLVPPVTEAPARTE